MAISEREKNEGNDGTDGEVINSDDFFFLFCFKFGCLDYYSCSRLELEHRRGLEPLLVFHYSYDSFFSSFLFLMCNCVKNVIDVLSPDAANSNALKLSCELLRIFITGFELDDR